MDIVSLSKVDFDPDIIPDKKSRLLKEAFELFRRASNLHEAAHSLNLQSYIMSDKMKMFSQMAIVALEKERNEVIEVAISRYQEYKNGLQSNS